MIAVSDVQAHCDRILDAVEQAVVGKREALELVLLGVLADGHVLIEDFPAGEDAPRAFLRGRHRPPFSRIQFTPDLMPSDVTGSSIYNQRTGVRLPAGPCLRQPPARRRDQPHRRRPAAALLEAMQERQVTLEGRRVRWSARSSCWPPRTRSSTRARTRCPRPARPFPAADRRRLSGARPRVGDARAPSRAAR